MNNKPKILVTNDDGIHASGIRSLWEGIKDHADVIVVAPSSEKSASGLSATLTKPLKIHTMHPWEEGAQIYSVNGTPADCVKLTLGILLKDSPPDLILSGINRGYNAGSNVLNSGTIGAVMEGVLRGIPGIAFSSGNFTRTDCKDLEKYIHPIVEHLIKNPIRKGSLFNVNFPENHHEGIKGLKLAKQGRSSWRDNPDKRFHPEGTPYYWLGGVWHEQEEEDNSDVALLKQGYATAVPLHIAELTDHNLIDEHQGAFEKLFEG